MWREVNGGKWGEVNLRHSSDNSLIDAMFSDGQVFDVTNAKMVTITTNTTMPIPRWRVSSAVAIITSTIMLSATATGWFTLAYCCCCMAVVVRFTRKGFVNMFGKV